MKKIKNILILAGGDSTRFWPLKNKSFFSFLDKPLVAHLIESVTKYIDNIFVIVNHNQLILARLAFNKKNIILIEQDKKLNGMSGAVLSTKGKIKGECLILNAEDIFDYLVLLQYINIIKQKKPEAIFLGKRVRSYFPGGYFRFQNKKLVEIIEKPSENKIPSDQVKLVIDYFSDFKRFGNTLKIVYTNKDDQYEQALNYLLKQGLKAETVLYDQYWLPLKYPWQVLPMMNFFLKKIIKNSIDKTASISPKAIIIPPVFIGENVRVGDFVKIVGPTYIGDETIIADHTIVYQSQIGKNCLIGGYSEVTRSYLGNQVMLHRNYVGDSVIDKEVMMGAGTATANFRFDGQPIRSIINGQPVDTGLVKLGSVIGSRSKIGVNATILPGIKIGQNSLIGPGEVVGVDIGDNKFKFQNKIVNNRI